MRCALEEKIDQKFDAALDGMAIVQIAMPRSDHAQEDDGKGLGRQIATQQAVLDPRIQDAADRVDEVPSHGLPSLLHFWRLPPQACLFGADHRQQFATAAEVMADHEADGFDVPVEGFGAVGNLAYLLAQFFEALGDGLEEEVILVGKVEINGAFADPGLACDGIKGHGVCGVGGHEAGGRVKNSGSSLGGGHGLRFPTVGLERD